MAFSLRNTAQLLQQDTSRAVGTDVAWRVAVSLLELCVTGKQGEDALRCLCLQNGNKAKILILMHMRNRASSPPQGPPPRVVLLQYSRHPHRLPAPVTSVMPGSPSSALHF